MCRAPIYKALEVIILILINKVYIKYKIIKIIKIILLYMLTNINKVYIKYKIL